MNQYKCMHIAGVYDSVLYCVDQTPMADYFHFNKIHNYLVTFYYQ